MKKVILIIDDDIQIGNLEQEVLTAEGYACERAYSGSEAMLILEKLHPDLIVLDLMLPGISGEEVLSRLENIPVIVVSAKVGIEDKVSLLLNGAVDYITKPFNIREFVARVTVALRKTVAPTGDVFTFDEIKVDNTAHMAFVGTHSLNLTKTEYALLKLLIQNPSQVIAKSVILDRISEDTPDCTESSLKTHISHLRTKLRAASGKDYIDSVWGIGFKLICE